MNTNGSRFYSQCWKQWGATPAGVGWATLDHSVAPYLFGREAFGDTTVLDVGCGIGIGMVCLRNQCRVYGCDVHRRAIQDAQTNFGDEGRWWVGDHNSIRGTFGWSVLGGIFTVGYPFWGEVENVMRKVWEHSEVGMSVGFSTGEETVIGRWGTGYCVDQYEDVGEDLGAVDIRRVDNTTSVMLVRRVDGEG